MTKPIQEEVKDRYGSIARSGKGGEDPGVRAVAAAFGYAPEELASIPANANLGVSCGNPTALARLRPGEVVVDLGSGAGLDVFLAAGKVGPTGKAIGIDMTPDMIERARRNATAGIGGRPFTNVEFHLATIDRLPLPDASVDCVISNCVINLAPDKSAVFREIARVLKPGGRLAVSDIALRKPLPPGIAADVQAYVGCVAGAILVEDYRTGLREAGFSSVQVIDSGADLRAYALALSASGASGSCAAAPSPPQSSAQSPQRTAPAGGSSPLGTAPRTVALPVTNAGCCESAGEDPSDRWRSLLQQFDPNEFAASVKVFAVKPGGPPER